MIGCPKNVPRWLTAIFGVVLLVLTAAIIGLEFGSFAIDAAHGTIWVGFWASIVFIMTTVMMFVFSKYPFV